MDYNICRLCLIPKRTDHPNFKNIFTTFENFNNRAIKIIDAIIECAPIQIKENDNFPKDICVNCLEKLQNSYEFREICVQSDLKLKSLSVIKKQEPTDNGSDLSDSHHNYDDLYEQENEKIIKEELIIEEEFGIAERVLTHETKSNDVKDENSSTESNGSNEDEATCNECGKKFISVKSYHRHLKQNHAHEFIKCMHCNRKFPNNVDLNLHNEKFHTFRCTICNETFVSEIQIEKHYIVIHFSTYVKKTDDEKNNSNLCYICGEEKTDLVNHLNCHKGMEKPRKTYKCKECEKNFTSSWSLNNHLLTHTGEKPFTCDFCNKSFRQKIILSVHRRIHTGETPFTCEVCNKSFRQKMHLSLHRLIHTDEKNYVCNLCPESFSTNTCLTNHKKETHQESNDGSKKSVASFQCSSCGKSFKQKRYLMVHIKNGHTEDKRHICEICSATFITKLNLKRHMTIHKEKPAIIGDRSPFPCNSCGKGFTSKQEHSEHIRLHAGEYAFVCDTCGDVFKAGDALRKHKLLKHTEDKAHHCTICSKEFARKDQLRLHLAVHNDDLPHKCGLCPKRFKWRVGLWRHEKSHTGELPYKCSVCNKGFIEAVKLRRHLRVHTGERPYKCEICFQSFPQSSTLKNHMNVHKN